jgi:hypothetical protein
VTIIDEGSKLSIVNIASRRKFLISAPKNSLFYCFAEHCKEGTTIIVSFWPRPKNSEWPDWHYKIDFKNKNVLRVNPWK